MPVQGHCQRSLLRWRPYNLGNLSPGDPAPRPTSDIRCGTLQRSQLSLAFTSLPVKDSRSLGTTERWVPWGFHERICHSGMIQILPAQLARKPLMDDAVVNSAVTIGPRAAKPLT